MDFHDIMTLCATILHMRIGAWGRPMAGIRPMAKGEWTLGKVGDGMAGTKHDKKVLEHLLGVSLQKCLQDIVMPLRHTHM